MYEINPFHLDSEKSADSTKENKFIKRAGQNHEKRKKLTGYKQKGSDTIQTDANCRQLMAQKVDIFDVGPKDAAVD